MPLLMWLFLTPILSSIIPFVFAKKINLKTLSFLLSLIPLVILVYGHSDWIGSVVTYSWFPALSIEFHLGVDALSLIFIYLTAIIIPISFFAIDNKKISEPNTFYGLILFLQGLLFGFFAARDLAMFTIFWESMLLPLYFIINLWGGSEHKFASLKFLIYMIAGSFLMVAATLALFFAAASIGGSYTFNFEVLSKIASGTPNAKLICAAFFLAFAVKTPLFPFHAWLPDAYCQAPAAGTILLSSLLSKAGIYGFLRIGWDFFPEMLKEWSPLFLTLSIIGVLYGALSAWRQNDFKRLIAYSSFSHVNFVLAGIFVWSQTAHSGAILQAFNHGVTIAALFLTASWLEDRIGTTAIGKVGGLAKFLPNLCWLTLFFVLAAVALPGTNNFVGEIMILFGVFEYDPWVAAILGTSIIFSVLYMLRWMQKVYFEEPSLYQQSWIDIGSREIIITIPLIILILFVGFYPSPILKIITLALVENT
jgi:NADH-quinone oxidoreductase subunit M